MQHEGGNRGTHARQFQIDLRNRALPRAGFIVDGAVAEALNVTFSPHQRYTDYGVAHVETESGIDVVYVRRPRAHALPYDAGSTHPVEILASLGVRQIVAVSMRLLVPMNQVVGSQPMDALTVGISHPGACTRLLAAVFDRCENEKLVDGVFLREDQYDLDPVLVVESAAAHERHHCVCVLDATAMRIDSSTHTGERALARIIRAIPDALSPLSSCYCVKETDRVDEPLVHGSGK